MIYHERFITDHYPTLYHEAEVHYLQCLEFIPDEKDANELLSILRSGSINDFWRARDSRIA
jgi:hypothetical protein